MSQRIEDIKRRNEYPYYADDDYRISKDDLEFLLRIVEAAEQVDKVYYKLFPGAKHSLIELHKALESDNE